MELPPLPDQRLTPPESEERRLLLRPLYGGAMQVLAERRFADASAFREIPSTQEVFLDADRDQSLIVEVVEMQDAPLGEQAARFFFSDLAESSEAAASEMRSWRALEEKEAPALAAAGVAAVLVDGEMEVSKFKEAATNTVRITMIVARLERVETDLLVTVNTSVRRAEDSSVADRELGADMHAAAVAAAAASIKINRWGLFTGEDE